MKKLSELQPGDAVVVEKRIENTLLKDIVCRVTEKSIYLSGLEEIRFDRETGKSPKRYGYFLRPMTADDEVYFERQYYIYKLTHLKRKDIAEFTIDHLRQLCEL